MKRGRPFASPFVQQPVSLDIDAEAAAQFDGFLREQSRARRIQDNLAAMLPKIDAALMAGVPYAEIAEGLHKAGLTPYRLKPNTLSKYCGQLRRLAAERGTEQPAAVPATAPMAPVFPEARPAASVGPASEPVVPASMACPVALQAVSSDTAEQPVSDLPAGHSQAAVVDDRYVLPSFLGLTRPRPKPTRTDWDNPTLPPADAEGEAEE